MTLYWPNWEAFWHMGGYALYVWGAFGVTAVALTLELLALRARRKSLRSGIDP